MKIFNDFEQGTPEWIAARLCKISGTRLEAALGTPTKQDSLINELIAEFLTGERKENDHRFRAETEQRADIDTAQVNFLGQGVEKHDIQCRESAYRLQFF